MTVTSKEIIEKAIELVEAAQKKANKKFDNRYIIGSYVEDAIAYFKNENRAFRPAVMLGDIEMGYIWLSVIHHFIDDLQRPTELTNL